MSDSESSGWESDGGPLVHPASSVSANGSATAGTSVRVPTASPAHDTSELRAVSVTVAAEADEPAAARKRRRSVTPQEKEATLTCHKSELVALIAALVHQVRLINSPLLQAVVLSVVPEHFVLDGVLETEPQHQHGSADAAHIQILQRLMLWFRFSVHVTPYPVPLVDSPLTVETLLRALQCSLEAPELSPTRHIARGTQIEITLIFGALCLALGFLGLTVASRFPHGVLCVFSLSLHCLCLCRCHPPLNLLSRCAWRYGH